MLIRPVKSHDDPDILNNSKVFIVQVPYDSKKIIQNYTWGKLAYLHILKVDSMRFSHMQCLEFAQFKLVTTGRKNLFYSNSVRFE